MTSRLLAVSFDAEDPGPVASFWAALLARDVVATGDDVLLPGTPTQVGLRFVRGAPATGRPNPLHLHVTSDGTDGQQSVVDAALALGAEHRDVGQLPDEDHVVLADPGGNEFCVIEPGNRYLAGCGPLGEVACEGSRDVGLFWSAVLDWPLVWDRDLETAVQSPAGGTKVAWGGEPVAHQRRRDRQRLELVPHDGDLADEVERLVALGAARPGGADGDDVVELVDPDGQPFSVSRS